MRIDGRRTLHLDRQSMMNCGNERSGILPCGIRLMTCMPHVVSSRGLVTLDRFISSSLGRPCAIQDEE